ncbi:hypothetical protein jhhlp_005999 [Lomentospora prolificans]|uniref:Ribosomal protein S21 n=1 Tax=Lomentospora prolificans TaxID=41688 RepID=A0A2N3N4P4_9PEZI|nr:hypothetical protein jhhlp_005999 [Lomentospora prolificans]
MAPLLPGRLLPVLRSQARTSQLFRLATGASFSTSSSILAQGGRGLPNLPPKPKSKGKDPLADTNSARPSPPYDATKSSIAQLIGADMTSAFASPDYSSKPIRVPIRSVPSTGRTVHVSGHVNAARAFALVNQRCIQNRIPAIANQQRFYERPGLKRKRLKRTRWRARFKKGFHATVVRVQELVRQGW